MGNKTRLYTGLGFLLFGIFGALVASLLMGSCSWFSTVRPCDHRGISLTARQLDNGTPLPSQPGRAAPTMLPDGTTVPSSSPAQILVVVHNGSDRGYRFMVQCDGQVKPTEVLLEAHQERELVYWLPRGAFGGRMACEIISGTPSVSQ